MRFDRSIITAPIGRPAQVLGGGVSRQKNICANFKTKRFRIW